MNSALGEKEKELEELSKELAELTYPPKLKKALVSAQEMINRLNSDLNSLKKEKEDLERENFSIKTKTRPQIEKSFAF